VPALGFAERAQLYAHQVLSGEIVAGKWVKAACKRHLDDLERSATDTSWPYAFDAERAARPCRFLECLPHVEGDWAKPVFVDGVPKYPKIRLENWQVFFVAGLFGWFHRITGLRRFRRAYLEVARKNAKSTLAAGLALYMLSADGEEGAQVWSAATKRDQAKIVWSIAQRMVQREPEFKMLGVRFTKRAIFQEDTGSKYEPLGRDSDTQDGLSSSCFISDELHAQKDRGLYDVLDSSTGARSQALGLGITTAGTNTVGVCYEQRTYLARILNVTLRKAGAMGYRLEGSEHEDETYFGLIYTLDTGYADKRPDDDWANPDVWIKANPNLGVSCLLDDMIAACTKAKASEASQGEFRTKRCSQWIAAEASWMDMAHWHACGEPGLREEDFAGEECCAALDAAFKTDIFAKVKVFRRGGDYYAFGKYWVPQRQVEMKGNEHLKAWASQGLVEVADGPVIDVELIKEDLRADNELHTVREVPYDPAQLTQFSTEMLGEGFEMVEVRPTVLNFSEPMKKLGELVLEGKFHHNGDPVLAWMVGNVVFHRDHKDNIYPNKANPADKIDGVIALIMALARITQGEPKQEEFVTGKARAL
jgi:phage terminase large subunit-like protein